MTDRVFRDKVTDLVAQAMAGVCPIDIMSDLDELCHSPRMKMYLVEYSTPDGPLTHNIYARTVTEAVDVVKEWGSEVISADLV